MRKLLLISIFLGIAIIPKYFSKAEIQDNPSDLLKPLVSDLKSGDLVFRSGKGFVSSVMRNTSQRDRTYSHVGLVVVKNGKPMVYHMMEKIENGKSISKLWCENLYTFCSQSQNNRITVYRFPLCKYTAFQIDQELKSLSIQKPAFDDHFDINSDDKLYCSEFVWKHFLKPAGIPINISHTPSGDYVGLDDLYLNPHAKKIFDIKFES